MATQAISVSALRKLFLSRLLANFAFCVAYLCVFLFQFTSFGGKRYKELAKFIVAPFKMKTPRKSGNGSVILRVPPPKWLAKFVGPYFLYPVIFFFGCSSEKKCYALRSLSKENDLSLQGKLKLFT